MTLSKLITFIILTIPFISGCGDSKQTERNNQNQQTESYELVADWPTLPQDFGLGQVTGLGIDSKNNVVVFQRAGRPWSFPPPEDKIDKNTIIVFDGENGKILKSWGSDLFLMPHGLEVDHEDNIWVTDVGLQQVLKFDSDGNLLMTLGEARVLGNDSTHFSLPTDVAVAADGSFYISDGYGNSRIVKYSKEGGFLLEWGKNGPDNDLNRGGEKGQFDIPHGIDLDKNGNVYVADRENNRIQKFDPDGKLITIWQNENTDQLFSLAIDTKKDHVFAIDFMREDTIPKGSDIFRFDLELNQEMKLGRSGNYDGPIVNYHDIAIDQKGNIYVGDIFRNKLQKFRLKTDGKVQ